MPGQGVPGDQVLSTLWGPDTTMGFRDLSNETQMTKNTHFLVAVLTPSTAQFQRTLG